MPLKWRYAGQTYRYIVIILSSIDFQGFQESMTANYGDITQGATMQSIAE